MLKPKLLVDCRPAPNPRRVRLFLDEKGVNLSVEQVNIMDGSHFANHKTRTGSHLVPAMQLEDGRWLTESVAICRYLEAIYPEPNLMGEDGAEVALIEMWNRRVEHVLFSPVAAVLHHGNPKMAILEDQCPEWAEANKPRVAAGLDWLNDTLSQTAFVAGERFTIADISALVAVDFMRAIRVSVPDDHAATRAWHARLKERPSYGA